MKKEDVYAYCYPGKRFDTGDKMGYIETIIDYALENKTMHKQLHAFLKQRIDR